MHPNLINDNITVGAWWIGIRLADPRVGGVCQYTFDQWFPFLFSTLFSYNVVTLLYLYKKGCYFCSANYCLKYASRYWRLRRRLPSGKLRWGNGTLRVKMNIFLSLRVHSTTQHSDPPGGNAA